MKYYYMISLLKLEINSELIYKKYNLKFTIYKIFVTLLIINNNSNILKRF